MKGAFVIGAKGALLSAVNDFVFRTYQWSRTARSVIVSRRVNQYLLNR
jgi:hypothetical protein